MQPYGTQSPPQSPYNKPQQAQAWSGPQMPGGLQMPGALSAIKPPSGLPAPVAFGLGLIAIVLALVFDVVFLHVHIPGIGGYAWYLTTALSFMGAGYGSAMWTRAGRTLSMVAVCVAAVLYGVADIGLGLVLESLPLGGALMLGIQGVVIGCVTGCGGVVKALRAKDD